MSQIRTEILVLRQAQEEGYLWIGAQKILILTVSKEDHLPHDQAQTIGSSGCAPVRR